MADQTPDRTTLPHDTARRLGPDALTAHLEREALLKREPWRSKLINVAALFQDLTMDAAKTLAGQKMLFADLAKAGRLSATDTIMLSHTLYGDDQDKLFLGFLLSERTGVDQIRLHNWRVASRMSDQWITANGPKVDQLTVPLFPPVPEFSYLNTVILNGEQGMMKGGGGHLFRQDKEPLVGAGAVPVANGWAVTDELEGWTESLVNTTAQQMQAELSQLRREVAEFR